MILLCLKNSKHVQFFSLQLFMRNIGTIISLAIFGTLLNACAIGFASYGVSSALGLGLRPIDAMVRKALWPCVCVCGGGDGALTPNSVYCIETLQVYHASSYSVARLPVFTHHHH